MKSFDELLKEGKEKAKTLPSPKRKWRDTVNVLMNALHALNSFYGDKQHYVKIVNINCARCKKASYSVVVRDIDYPQRPIRYHRGGWQAKDRDTYYCNMCK